jgi:uncharacterized delta-60 repeat protein
LDDVGSGRGRSGVGRLAHLACAVASLACATAAAAAPGDLDPSFAGTGWTRTLEVRPGAINYLPRGAGGVAVQADGRIVVAGAIEDGQSNTYFGAVRYLPDGGLDPSFGAGGLAAVDLGSFETPRAVAIQADGKIVVAGETACSTALCFAAMRLNPDGTLDAGFGAGGVMRKGFYLQASWADDVAIQRDGRIVLAGSRLRGGDAQDNELTCVVRLLPDGRLDPSFDGDGAARLDMGYGNDGARAVAIQRGRIVVAGRGRDHAAGARFGVARFLANGRLDRSFARRGYRTVSFGRRRLAAADALAAMPDGRLLLGGSATVEGRAPEMAVVRLTANGALDRTFGDGGRLRTTPGPFGGTARAIAALADGRVLVAGRAFTDATRDPSDWALVRYTSGGLPDRSFGAAGIVRTDFGTGSDEATALATVPGRIVVAGSIYASHGVARYLMR